MSELAIDNEAIKKKKTVLWISLAVVVIIAAFLTYIFLNAAPKLKGESLNAKEVRISWKAVRNAELYNVYRMDESSGEYKKINTVKESKFTDSSLKPNSSYWYKVAVIRNGKEEKLSSPVTVITKSLPAAPSKVSTEAVTFDSAEVKWNKVKDAEKYYIYRTDNDKDSFIQVGESTSNNFKDSKLRSTTKYTYRITTVNKNGESDFSSVSEAVTKEKVNDSGNSGNNLMNRGLATEQGDWLYFTNKSGFNSLYKVRKDGTSMTKLYDGYISNLNVVGEWIYFSNDYKLCKIKTDGSGYTQLNNDIGINLSVVGDWIYYDLAEGFCKIKTDGSQKVKLSDDHIAEFNIDGDWIYYSNISDRNRLYKIKTDGSNKTKLNEDISQTINVSGDWIYYENFSDDKHIYKIKTDGTSRQVVLANGVNMFNVVGDTIIYEYWEYGGRLFKSDTDGKNSVQLTDSHYNCINIVDNYIFCYDFDNRNLRVLKLKDDGKQLDKTMLNGSI
ncbi:MAG: DUF5050 domain-containing protein [Bacillota bacterium]|nr:DUF5050 domain-containing protein [Bacillota bacterium]